MKHTKQQTGRPIFLTIAVLILVTVMLIQSIFVFTLSMRPTATAYSSAYVSVNVTSAPTVPPQGPGGGGGATAIPPTPPIVPPVLPPTAPNETCTDGIQNQDETDIDCGGTICEPCITNQGCAINADCGTKYCRLGICKEPEIPLIEFPAALGLLSQWLRDALLIIAMTLAIIAVGALIRTKFRRALRRLFGRPSKGLKPKKRRAYRKS